MMTTLAPETEKQSAGPALVINQRTTPSARWNAYLERFGFDGFHLRSEWGRVFADALHHTPLYLEARRHHELVGVLPLMLIRGLLFGRFLVSQPYLNTGGILADDEEAALALADHAVALADRLDVRHLELRHEKLLAHPKLVQPEAAKVHMRLSLPQTTGELWDGLKSKVRSQVRKPLERSDLQAEWGREDQLSAFYSVFAQNMRDLGTPPFSQRLFRCMLSEFGDNAEICTIRLESLPVASAFLLHGSGVTFVPSASSLRRYNSTSANMLLYWQLLSRAVERGSSTFDFGRSSEGCGTWRFKKQWGAVGQPAAWQYYQRQGELSEMRPDSGRYDRLIAVWKRLPVWLTRLIGPAIVRGIP